ncbi:AvrD family protein [Agrobacterium leguminum]
MYATLKKIKLLDQGTEYWRCADINTVLCGMNLTCSVAHMLPSSSIAAKVA